MNPKVQVVMGEKLKATLEAEAKRQGKTLSSYCSELLSLLHTYPWIVIQAPRELTSKIKALLK